MENWSAAADFISMLIDYVWLKNLQRFLSVVVV